MRCMMGILSRDRARLAPRLGLREKRRGCAGCRRRGRQVQRCSWRARPRRDQVILQRRGHGRRAARTAPPLEIPRGRFRARSRPRLPAKGPSVDHRLVGDEVMRQVTVAAIEQFDLGQGAGGADAFGHAANIARRVDDDLAAGVHGVEIEGTSSDLPSSRQRYIDALNVAGGGLDLYDLAASIGAQGDLRCEAGSGNGSFEVPTRDFARQLSLHVPRCFLPLALELGSVGDHRALDIQSKGVAGADERLRQRSIALATLVGRPATDWLSPTVTGRDRSGPLPASEERAERSCRRSRTRPGAHS